MELPLYVCALGHMEWKRSARAKDLYYKFYYIVLLGIGRAELGGSGVRWLCVEKRRETDFATKSSISVNRSVCDGGLLLAPHPSKCGGELGWGGDERMKGLSAGAPRVIPQYWCLINFVAKEGERERSDRAHVTNTRRWLRQQVSWRDENTCQSNLSTY